MVEISPVNRLNIDITLSCLVVFSHVFTLLLLLSLFFVLKKVSLASGARCMVAVSLNFETAELSLSLFSPTVWELECLEAGGAS
jgi:hypothetical protein